MEAYQGAVRVDGAHHTAALALAKLHLDKGEEEAGRGVCAQLLTSSPDNVEAQLLMVQLLTTQVRKQKLVSREACSSFEAESKQKVVLLDKAVEHRIPHRLMCRHLCSKFRKSVQSMQSVQYVIIRDGIESILSD